MVDALAAKCLQCGRSFPSEEELEEHECSNEQVRSAIIPAYEYRADCNCSACVAEGARRLNDLVKVEEPEGGGSVRS